MRSVNEVKAKGEYLIMWHQVRFQRQVLVLGVLLMLVLYPFAGLIWAADPPDSGNVLDQVNRRPASPPKEKPDEIAIQDPLVTDSSDEQVRFRVNGFRLVGETIVPEQELLDLIADKSEQDLSLDDLYGLAARITKYLRQKGYLVAFAYIPAQRMEDGILTIAVVPGELGQAKINNNASIAMERLEKMVALLKPNSVITKATLERVLLLINDLAGVSVKATLAPGEAPGTADLILDVNDIAKLSGGINSDNGGNPSTGRTIGGIQFTINNLTNTGDQLRLGGLVSDGDLDHVYFNYGGFLGHTALHWGLNYSNVRYSLGEEFTDLNATGIAKVVGCNLNYPWIRSRALNLYGTAGFEFKRLEDEIGSADMRTPRTDRLWKIGFYGDAVDSWLGNASSDFSLSLILGHLNIDDEVAAIIDENTAQTAGSFSKLVLDYNRTQYFSSELSLNCRLSGQLANGNLDSSEKFYLGGINGVRAYGQGVASGDQGCLFSTELRWRMPDANPGKNDLYFTCFYDYGDVSINKDPWPGAGDNHRTLKGPGLGVIWTSPGYTIRADYAFQTGDKTADDDNSRLWARFMAYF
jgi:hemolysin activation/secretion protein